MFESSYQPYAFPLAENKVWSAALAGAAIVTTATDAVAAATATVANFETNFMCYSPVIGCEEAGALPHSYGRTDGNVPR
ncbi:hypothetical protein GCM10027039_41310 [Terrabacter koreensis]